MVDECRGLPTGGQADRVAAAGLWRWAGGGGLVAVGWWAGGCGLVERQGGGRTGARRPPSRRQSTKPQTP